VPWDQSNLQDAFTHDLRPRVAPGPPPRRAPSADDVPIPPARTGSGAPGPVRGGSSVPLRTDRSAWHPALPRQHRHDYTADLHRGLPTRHAKPASEVTIHTGRPRIAPRPISARLEPVPRLRSFTTGSSRIPSDPARRTQPVWQCQAVPALSALLPTRPASPESGCAQLLPGCCGSPARRSPTSFGSQRLTAHRRLVAHDFRTDPAVVALGLRGRVRAGGAPRGAGAAAACARQESDSIPATRPRWRRAAGSRRRCA
jgi:hypothetical protein